MGMSRMTMAMPSAFAMAMARATAMGMPRAKAIFMGVGVLCELVALRWG